ncbi:hypothetical protein AUJ16_01080, partial [Candidatus Micrarchaeota archaeon CG1_02_60_51]
MEFNKARDCVFESGKVRVYASDEMLAQMQRDRTLGQIGNVAALPGLEGKAMVMPDGHEGYGFPIGGVAAFNFDDGIVSPGGVGYDINCLSGDSRIESNMGYWKKISSYEPVACEDAGRRMLLGGSLQTLNARKSFEPKRIMAFMSKNAAVYELKTRSGFSVKASADHPFLTEGGMKQLACLTDGERVVVRHFEGAEYDAPFSLEGFSEEATGVTAKVIGYLLGDGCASKTGGKIRVQAFGNKSDLEKMQRDLASIGVKSSVFERTRACKINTQYGNKEFVSSCGELHIYSREFCGKLVELGLPLGRKTIAEYGVPNWVMNAPKWVKRLFLAGFFGAELTTPKTHCKTGFYAPILAQNKNSEAKQSGRAFLIQVMRLLEEFGVETTKLAERSEQPNQKGETVRLRLEISAEEKNLEKLWRKIGFEYNEKRSNAAEIACAYITLKRGHTAERKQAREKARELKTKGLTINEIARELGHNKRFVERSVYEKTGARLTLDFASFEEFATEKAKEIKAHGGILDEIETIEPAGIEKVYDFTVEDNHNFVANGFIVSNCGVRLVRTNLSVAEAKPKMRELVDALFEGIPSGVGSKGRIRISDGELGDAVTRGAAWALENGYGTAADAEHCEEDGAMKGADYSKVSDQAKKRGRPQFGTLGSGNHFLEVQKVEKIFDAEKAKAFGLQEGQVCLMIHSGSRGFGHQVCDDYIRVMLQAAQKYGISLPDKELCCAPLKSKEAQDYVAAMACAINYAFINRQAMTHWAREAFEKTFKRDWESLGMTLLYDVCHNIAKTEEHDGKKLCVHRKGATRAFWAGRPEIPSAYRQVGQPVIIPGSMQTASYVLCGLPGAAEAWGSTCHGSGRTMSRSEALRTYRGVQIQKDMEASGVTVRT